MTDFEKVIDFNNMYRAFRRAKCGKGYKKSSARFNLAALDGVHTLIEQLRNKTYRVSDYNEFKVYEPKERIIQTTSFKDKVIQHSLCDNVIMPRLQRVFIYDNCAGQKEKGTLFGLDRLSKQMEHFHRKYGFNGYILKCDITKFFYNIAHPQLKDIVEYHFGYDPDILWLCNLFIDSTEGKGIPLGNQINQGFALLYLDGMDKLIKYELGIEYYGRYMDDFWLIHPSKEYLKYCLEVITAYLETLDLTLNGKTQIFPFKNGVSYLGFHTYITAEGMAIRRLKNQNKRNAQRKFLRMAKLVAAGKLPEKKFRASYNAWKNHISHGNCHNLGESMDEAIRAFIINKEQNIMRKAMLSQPMAGKTNKEIVETRERAVNELQKRGYQIVNTLFTDDWYSKEQMEARGVVQIPLCFLAKSLENMSLCHAAYFCKGWEQARGCRIEHEAAKAYGLEVIYEE